MIKNTTSIIIPVFNTSVDALDRSIRSAIFQSAPVEILVIDDGSNELTASYLDDNFAHLQNVTVIHKPNGGVSSARNVGLEYAQGEFIAFLDADDELKLSFLSDAVKILENAEIDAVFGGLEHRMTDGRVCYEQCQFLNCGNEFVQIKKDKLDLLRSSLFNRLALVEIGLSPAMYVSNCSALYRASSITGIRFNEDIVISEDRLFNWSVFDNVECIALSGQVWYQYYQNESSSSMKLRPNAATELANTAQAFLDHSVNASSYLLHSVSLGLYECYKQALNFSIFRASASDFVSITGESKSAYVKKILTAPPFQHLFKNCKIDAYAFAIISIMVKLRLYCLVYYCESFYHFIHELLQGGNYGIHKISFRSRDSAV